LNPAELQASVTWKEQVERDRLVWDTNVLLRPNVIQNRNFRQRQQVYASMTTRHHRHNQCNSK
jgi:hypothetical protein